MPTQFTTSARKVSAGVIDDKRVNSLPDPWAMLGHIRILLKMDNLGRIESDPVLIKSMIFPRNLDITVDDCEAMCREYHDKGLFFYYTCNDESYLQAVTFGEHQRMVGNMVRNSALPAPNVHNFYKWLCEVRKDDDFVDLPEDTAITRIVALLNTSMQHVVNELDTGSLRVCTKRKEKNRKERKGKEVKESKKSYAQSEKGTEKIDPKRFDKHSLAGKKGMKPYEIANTDTGEISSPYVANNANEAWLLCQSDHPDWKYEDVKIYEHRG